MERNASWTTSSACGAVAGHAVGEREGDGGMALVDELEGRRVAAADQLHELLVGEVGSDMPAPRYAGARAAGSAAGASPLVAAAARRPPASRAGRGGRRRARRAARGPRAAPGDRPCAWRRFCDAAHAQHDEPGPGGRPDRGGRDRPRPVARVAHRRRAPRPRAPRRPASVSVVSVASRRAARSAGGSTGASARRRSASKSVRACSLTVIRLLAVSRRSARAA